jgi:hypothetical protein
MALTRIFIISFNRPTMLRRLVERLRELRADAGIVIIDNASTFPPLLDYYAELSYPVIRLRENLGHRVLEHLWADEAFRREHELDARHYAYTDCDVVPHHDCTEGFLDVFAELLLRYPWSEKVGFGLAIDDLPEHSSLVRHREEDSRWRDLWCRQQRYWSRPLEPGVFEAPIDTTLALRRAGTRPGRTRRAIRTGHPLIAHHLPWYLDDERLDEEYRFYLSHVAPNSGVTTWLQKAPTARPTARSWPRVIGAGRLLAWTKRRRPRFDRVERFLLFLGDGRTGSTLTGSLIDAHPDACVALEENALDHVAAGMARDALLARLAANSARHRKRRWTGYSYRVLGQSQGRVEAPRVMGDKQAGAQTVRLVEEPGLWRRLYDLVGVRVKAIHSVRNPYDVIATRFRWRSRNATLDGEARTTLLDWLIDDHFRICEAAARFARTYEEVEVLYVAHEAFVGDPVAMLRRVCGFVGLPATADYLRDCSRIVAPSPHRSRSDLEWTEPQLREVARRAAEFPFLDGYSFDS